MRRTTLYILTACTLLLAGCFGSRYVSADPDLEAIYVGSSYYDVVNDFGRPDATMKDAFDGTKIAYNSVTLSGTKAADLYRNFNMRNGATRVTGAPYGGITFSFDADMVCYAVNSDFQHEKVKEPKAEKPGKPLDPRKPGKVKPKIPRVLEFPYYKSCSPFAEVVSIERVEIDHFETTVHFQYKDRTPARRPLTDVGLYIMPEVYIEDMATGQRYALVEMKGITPYPERTQFAHNRGGYDILVYSLVFEPLPPDVEFINIVEPGHSGFNFYGVDVRTPLSEK